MKSNLSNDNECFIADNIAKDICFFVLSSEKQVSPRSNCSCKNFNHKLVKGTLRVVALEAEVLEKQQMLAKSEHQSSLIQKQFVDLQLKFQNYKERLRNEKLQRKDDTIRNLETHINITRMLNEGPNAAAAFMANLSSISGTNGATTSQVNEVNQEQCLVNDSLRAELAKCKLEIVRLDTQQDLHKDILGRSNPRYGKKAPVINVSNMWDTDEALASAEVSMAKMKGKPGHKELSQEQVYWLPAEELATQKSERVKFPLVYEA
ncbi:hypothetical protein Tco_1504587 [Tanacetum coccineum]